MKVLEVAKGFGELPLTLSQAGAGEFFNALINVIRPGREADGEDL